MRRVLALSLLLVTGCASAPAGPAVDTSASLQQRTRKVGKVGPAGARPIGDEAKLLPEPLAGDPYAERPGAEEAAEEVEPRAVSFCLPAPKNREPISPDRRPPLPPSVKLSVVFVRSGEIVHDAHALLALDALLDKDPDVHSVLALGPLTAPEADLPALIERARLERRDLLVVDVRPGSGEAERESFLVHVERGVLLAHHAPSHDEIKPQPASTGAREDLLLGRVGQALARLRP